MSVAVAPVLPMLFAQTRAQLLNYVRIPAFSLTSLALPHRYCRDTRAAVDSPLWARPGAIPE